MDVVPGDREEDERSRQVQVRLDTYALEKMDDTTPRAFKSPPGVREQRFVGFVTDTCNLRRSERRRTN